MQNLCRENKKIYPLYDCVEFSWLSNGGTRLVLRFKICEKIDFKVKKKIKNKNTFFNDHASATAHRYSSGPTFQY